METKTDSKTYTSIDVETDKNGYFICAGAFDGLTYRYFDTTEDLYFYILHIKSPKTTFLFFNLNYDKPYFNKIIKSGSVLRSGGQIITFKFINGAPVIDLTRHVPYSLERWIDILDLGKKEGIEKTDLTNLSVRVKNDTKATYFLGIFLQDFYADNGCDFKLTISSASFYNFLKNYVGKFILRSFKKENIMDVITLERSSYFGGRVECFQRGEIQSYNYDVNSMYPTVMSCNNYPLPSSYVLISENADYIRKKITGHHLFIADITVSAPEKKIMVLPVKKNDKNIYPYGVFRGTWCSPEIELALQNGYKILRTHSLVYYRYKKRIFYQYINNLYKKRLQEIKNGNQEKSLMYKLMMNSVYGKFAQINDVGGIFELYDNVDELPSEFQLIEYNNDIYVYKKGKEEYPFFYLPVLSSFVTSYARAYLYRLMSGYQNSMVYCDTDSLKITVPIEKKFVSGELGMLKFEGYKKINFVKSKFYGEVIKGVPKNAEKIKEDKDYIWFKYVKPLRERSAIRQKKPINIWQEQFKKLDKKDDKRIWNGGQSKPIELGEV